ncbi:ATP-binding protein [Actinoplanes sp. KI2]|uniref:NACHT domain-containing protein n=1 Tax=Actinoplanes sp. KI2 TaxID=2983315 RepID=UPI0021D5B31D|nr:ATP-binding protein [Actinoplanes sp. KI2]MCU7725797.1 ATP-binding protein [Actinoplanes sp. KI2]
MRSRPLCYADAARLLGSADSPVMKLLAAASGAAATAVSVGTLGGSDIFALRGELIAWGNAAVTGLRERLSGVRRFDRTERLVAAHAIIVLTAFYEALDAVLADHPDLDLSAARLTAGEQVAVATSAAATDRYAAWVRILVETPPPMPTPHRPFETTLAELDDFYGTAATALTDFLLGLSAFRGREGRIREVLSSAEREVRRAAAERYVQAYRRLCGQAPEFAVWAAMVDTQATRSLLRESMADLSAQLAGLRAASLVNPVDTVLEGLPRRYRAALDTPILASAHTPTHVALPGLGDSYIDPRGRVSVAGPRDFPATEEWWNRSDAVDDVQGFLLAHLTGPDSVAGPLVVLGQPGSGKSAMTKVLAARLPTADFLVVRVALRNVPADSPIQTQIEEALLQMLGERVSWPDLVRRAGHAMPVVILDGFDELLQATGMNRADYLELIRDFQQREEELGRPVAVLVTSRTVVADRVRFPDGTVVLRLEPFDESQVRAWLDVWNAHNAAGLHLRGLRPLSAATALAHGELARQPLLLLLLALYDAGANALQSATGNMLRVDLYERLFADFVEREVDKQNRGRADDNRQAEIDAEWRRLGAIAVAALNRGSDVILEAELNNDLPHLLWEGDLRPAPSSADRALSVSQMMVGRFFFVHESRATRDTGRPERSFEFLHATFGDFLAARQIVAALVDVAGERIHQRRRQGVFDPGPLYAITSFVTVARRAPLWDFCRGLLGKLDPERRRSCRELALDLLPEAGYPHPTWSRGDYEPRRIPQAGRHAAFSANLVCFAVLLSDGPVDAAELVGEPVVDNWRRQALLWQSQLDAEDGKRMWQTLRVEWQLAADPTRLQVRPEDGTPISVYESLPWPPDDRPATYRRDEQAPMMAPDVSVAADSRVGRSLRRSAFVQTAHDVRECLYDLMPYWQNAGEPSLHLIAGEPYLVSEAALFLQLLLSTANDQPGGVRARQYGGALALIRQRRQRNLLIRQLVDDAPRLTAAELEYIFHNVASSDGSNNPDEFLAILSATTDRNLALGLLNAISWDFSDDLDDPVREGLYRELRLADPFTKQ